jgi:hypothetical protein
MSELTVAQALLAENDQLWQEVTALRDSLTGDLNGKAQDWRAKLNTAKAAGQVLVDALGPVYPEPKPPNEYGPDCPEATKEWPINNQADLENVKGKIQPGEHGILKAGVSFDMGNLTRAGTEANPIYWRCKSPLGATLRGATRLNTSYNRILDVKSERGLFSLGSADSHKGNGLRRVQAYGHRGDVNTSGPVILHITGDNHFVELFELFDTVQHRGIWINPNSAAWRIKWSHFHDMVGSKKSQTAEPITCGEGGNTRIDVMNGLVKTCLFRKVNVGDEEDEAISDKSSGNRIEDCEFDDARNCNFRFGYGGVFTSILLKSGLVNIHDRDNMLINVHSAGGFNLVKGNCDSAKDGKISKDTTGGASPHGNALRSILEHCKGTVFVGKGDFGQFRAKGIKLYGHDGSINNVQGGAQEWVSYPPSDAGSVAKAPRSIPTSEVGPNAGR